VSSYLSLCGRVTGKAEVLWAVAAVRHVGHDSERCSSREEHVHATEMGKCALISSSYYSLLYCRCLFYLLFAFVFIC